MKKMTVTDDVKLPKQWKNWCQRMGLRRHTNSIKKWDRNFDSWLYLKGHGHVWRVNCYHEFERGDTYEDFDRWALCNIDRVPTIPQTFEEFKNAVENLLHIFVQK
jgi:hypothetical protein